MVEEKVECRSFSVESNWGVGTFRPAAGFPSLDGHIYHYDCPLGANVIRWDIENQTNLISFQAHSDMITCMIKNPIHDISLTISYNGEAKLWSKSYKTLLCSFQLPTLNYLYAAWSTDGKCFGCCSKGPTAILVVYEVEIARKGEGANVKLLWYKKCEQLEQEMTNEILEDDKNLETPKKIGKKEIDIEPESVSEQTSSAIQVESCSSYTGFIFTEYGKVIATLGKRKGQCEAHLFNSSGEILSTKTISPLGEPNTVMMCVSASHKGIFAVGLQRGIFVFMDSENLEMKAVVQATASPQVCIWDGDLLLVVSYLSGVISWLSIDGNIVKEFKGGPTGSIVHLNWSVPGKDLWIGGIMSLHYVCLPEYNSEVRTLVNTESQEENEISRLSHPTCQNVTEKFTFSKLELTGCGLDVSQDNRIASGDFAGNVFIWKKGNESALEHLFHQGSIRSLLWCGSLLFVGTLDGLLTVWNPKNTDPDKYEIAVTHHFNAGIVTMRKSHLTNRIAIGTTSGELYAFSYIEISDMLNNSILQELKQEVYILAHQPKVSGHAAEKVPMEIWSVCWSPTDIMIATSSEDQTTCIRVLNTGEKVATLTGHTSAVTAVDWKQLSNSQCIIATCADDRTVRITDGNNFNFIKVLDTKEIYGWYTLTYMSINPKQNWILCSSQNGYLVLWDISSGTCLLHKRMHCGSIEGLSWNHDFKWFASVGSDCVVNMLSISNVTLK